jgi:hypothetical protein
MRSVEDSALLQLSDKGLGELLDFTFAKRFHKYVFLRFSLGETGGALFEEENVRLAFE